MLFYLALTIAGQPPRDGQTGIGTALPHVATTDLRGEID